MEGFVMTARQVNLPVKEVHAEDNELVKAAAEEKRKGRNLGSTMSLKKAHLASSVGNAFQSANQPEVIRMAKGMPLVGGY